MRALSIRQPFVELILRGDKLIEYRSRSTKIRGTVLIYSSTVINKNNEQIPEQELYALPVGLVVGTIDITDCKRNGDHFEWILKDPRRFETPIKPALQPQPVWFYPFGKANKERSMNKRQSQVMHCDLKIESISVDMLPDLLKLMDKYLPELYPESYDNWKEKLHRNFLTQKKTGYAAFVSGKLVGILIFQNYTQSPKDTLEIKTLLVIRSYRQTKYKVGTRLLERFHKKLSRQGFKKAIVEATVDSFVVPWLICKGYKPKRRNSTCILSRVFES